MKVYLKNRKVYRIGINDADYVVEKGGDFCPYYLRWKTMLFRVYKKPYTCYKNTNVCDEWLVFSNFKKWMETKDWQGKHLDKDLLGDGTLYSPDTCCFIDPIVNSFIAKKPYIGKYEIGVSKSHNRYFARCSNPMTGKREVVGRFNCETAAMLAYKATKIRHTKSLAATQPEPIRSALLEKLGMGAAGVLDFDLESYTLSPELPKEQPIMTRKVDNDIPF